MIVRPGSQRCLRRRLRILGGCLVTVGLQHKRCDLGVRWLSDPPAFGAATHLKSEDIVASNQKPSKLSFSHIDFQLTRGEHDADITVLCVTCRMQPIVRVLSREDYVGPQMSDLVYGRYSSPFLQTALRAATTLPNSK
jgi:hypothetical protein